MLSHELLRNYHRDKGTPRCTAKIDLKKAYDLVRWDLIIEALKAFKFPDKFIHWVSTCITTAKYSIMVNGFPVGYFSGCRGIRQGDPPYLFVLVMEVLAKLLALLQVSEAEGRLKLHPRCKSPQITHMSFADDLMLFFKADVGSAAVRECLDQFHLLAQVLKLIL